MKFEINQATRALCSDGIQTVMARPVGYAGPMREMWVRQSWGKLYRSFDRGASWCRTKAEAWLIARA